ncbi:hypothetical protein ACJIZ3_004170 [Penstemon smallii]|uniref:Uncharacterized protein n=1 Tax=Penstemon smallii TaxID=265156 RepID=A0ABD3S1A1_9LAMI
MNVPHHDSHKTSTHNTNNGGAAITHGHGFAKTEKKKTEGHNGHCLPKMNKNNLKKNKKKGHNKSDCGSSSDSESDDDVKCSKK